jgi:SPP1 gp7 family putative phage head morphogenesis protein
VDGWSHYDECRLAAWACEEIARKRYGVDISKALNPLNPLDFVTISVRLARALRGATKGAEAVALKGAIQTLDVDWPNISAAQRQQIVAAARREVSQIADAAQRAERVLENSAGKMVPWTKAASIKRHGLSISKDLTDLDRETADLLRKSQMVYVKDEYGRRVDAFDQQAKAIVAGGLERGLGRDDISGDLSSKLSDYQINRSRNYWNLIATDFANKARTTTQVNAFGDAGVDEYVYEAVMDEVTSDVCRLLHGKVFTVRRAQDTMREAISIKDPEDIKQVRPWVQLGEDGGKPVLYFNNRDGEKRVVADVLGSGVGEKDAPGKFRQRMSDSELEAAGVVVPPSHGFCRATIVVR